MRPVTARPTSAQMNSCQPVTEPPPVSASGVAKPMNQAMMMATPTIDSAPVTSRPLYSAFMMPLSGPSLTKYVPTIEVRMQIAADAERQHQHVVAHLAGEEDRRQQHGGDDGHGVGLEQVGGHAGAVAHVVAHVVGDHGGVAGVVLGDAGLDLADQVGADIGALGEDAAAETGEDRDQRAAEAQRHHRLEHAAQFIVAAGGHAAAQHEVVAGDAEQAEADHQHAGDGAGLEGDVEAGGKPLLGRLGGADIGAHRDVHADIARRGGQHGADDEADRDVERPASGRG